MVLWNSRCLLYGSSSAQMHGRTLTVRFAIRFNPVLFSGSHNMNLAVVDTRNQTTPSTPYHSWNVPSEGCGHFLVSTRSTQQIASPPRAKWPDDQSCPLQVGPVPVSDGCSEFGGKWIDQAGGVWSLVQAEDRISGTYKAAKTDCGVVSWHVSGVSKDGTWILNATQPHPSVDDCGVTSAPSVTAIIFPDCANGTRVQVKD